MGYEVTMTDGGMEQVRADAYRQEGQMVTFYRLEPGRRTIDCWARPVASYRTARLERVRLLESADHAGAVGPRLAS